MKEENRKRDIRMTVRFNEDEKKIYDEKVKMSNLTSTEYYRKTLLGENIYIIGSAEEMNNIYWEIHKLGVNMNQIAKNLNSNIYSGADEDVKLLLRDYDVLLDKINSIYKLINQDVKKKRRKHE